MDTIEKINSFTKELSYIKDEKLRKFVEIILDSTGDWFFKDPASTSGKYHPKFALGNGGLLRHTKAVVYWVQELSRTELFDVNERQIELLTAGAIIHDIRKHTASGSYIANHARAAYNLVMEMQEQHTDLISKEDAQYIADPVSTHMGIWGIKDKERKPTSNAEKLLHLADYCASRKEINMEFPEPLIVEKKVAAVQVIDFESNNKKAETTPEVKQEQEPKVEQSFVFNFGKYRGKTIDEVYIEKKDYLDWIISQTDFFDKDVQKKIKEYVENKK